MISDSDDECLYHEQNLTTGTSYYGFSIIKPHFINNFHASACDPIHFQDMQRA